MSEEIEGFSYAAQSADKPPEDAAKYAQECADAKRWLKRIKEARTFDEPARKQYALDRRTARGDSGGFEVNVPIAGPYTDILKSFLYARNPDLDVQPSESVNPPPMAEIVEMAREQIGSDPNTHVMMEQVGMQAAQAASQAASQASLIAPQTALGPGKQPVPAAPVPPEQAGEAAAQAWLMEAVKAKAKEIMAPYHKRKSDAKQLGQTIELVVSKLWKQAKLKAAADDTVGSCVTIGIGWIKATWQERSGSDPRTENNNQDVQDALDKLNFAKEELADGEVKDEDAAKADITNKEAGLQAHVEVLISRGLAIDFVRAEDIQVSLDVSSLRNYTDSPWIAHRSFVPKETAKSQYPDIEDKLDKATLYFRQDLVDPKERRDIGSIALDTVTAAEADSFVVGGSPGKTSDKSPNVCVWELWNRDDNMVLTLVEGVECYARPPFPPNPGTTRFYPFFALAMLWVDGERHPESLIHRTQSLLNDVSNIYSNRREHRRRCLPKMGFNASGLPEDEAKKITSAATGELVAIRATNPEANVEALIKPIHYPAIDGALYDDRPTMKAIETAWGIQEALAASVQTTKTATEAEIQQTGTNARTTHMRSAIDAMMDDLAQYTTEVSLQKLQHKDVVEIAGPWAFWPEGITVDDLGLLVEVAIKGGSSGKPDTSAQQQAWATTMPILQKSIMLVGQLRGSAPADIADCIEELVSETLNRTGDRLDPTRFLPPAPSTQPGQPPPPPGQVPPAPQPGAPQGAPMPALQPPVPDPGVLPIPHHGHIYVDQHNGAH